METTQKDYKDELKLLLTETEEEIFLLTLAYEHVGQHIITRLFKKLIIIFAEIFFYGIFVLAMLGLIALQLYVPLQFDIILSESATLRQTLIVNEVEKILLASKILLFLIALFNLFLGLLFRKLRRKNNKLQEVAEIFESLIQLAKERLERIKELVL